MDRDAQDAVDRRLAELRRNPGALSDLDRGFLAVEDERGALKADMAQIVKELSGWFDWEGVDAARAIAQKWVRRAE